MAKKRGNPFKRGKTWYCIYYIKGIKGENKTRIQKWKGGYPTKEEAEIALAKFRYETSAGLLRNQSQYSNKPLIDYLEIWLNIRMQELKPNTINAYREDIQKYIIPSLEHLKLKEVTTQQINALYNKMAKQGLSVSTIKHTNTVLKTALKYAVEEGHISENPCNRVRIPKSSKEKFKHHPLSKEQIQVLLKYLISISNTDKYANVITIALLLGLRRGEVLGIKAEDIDFKRHTLTIHRQVCEINDKQQDGKDDIINLRGKSGRQYNHYGLTGLKSPSSYRTLDIESEIEELFKQQIDRNKELQVKNPDYYIDNGLIFCNECGDILLPGTLDRHFKKALKQCDLPEIRFHDLRHSYATLCIDMNKPIKAISQLLGHSSLAVTDMIYADSISAKKRIASEITSLMLGKSDNNT